MRTHDEIMKELYTDFSEEISSGTKYMEMADSARGGAYGFCNAVHR